jgi:hypothetical protein
MACLFYSANGEPSFANAQNPEFQISAFTPRQLRPVMRLLAAAPECL